MKISKKYYNVVLAIVISFIMSLVVGFFITVVSFGFTEEFLFRWMQVFISGWATSLPIAFVVVPVSRRIADKVTE